MDKKDIRRIYRDRRNGIPEQEAELKSNAICRRILELPEYKKADAVLCYMAFRSEVNLKNIMLTEWASNRKIFLPRMDGNRMEFYPVSDEKNLIVNDIGIAEPDPEEDTLPDILPPGSRILMIVPGLVFDRRGYRLGYGGGYYDRYLNDNKGRYDITTVAAAFSLQISEEELPAEEYDVAVDMIVTEDRVIRRDNMSELTEMGKRAKAASFEMSKLGTTEKNKALLMVADALIKNSAEIIKANKIDLENGEANGMSPALMDRLRLTDERLEGIADGVRKVADLDDPIGEILSMKKRPNGLMIGQMRVPMGVIGIIYESRPNVTVDSFALTFKAGNAAILRGGSDCIHSNLVLVRVIREALQKAGVPEDSVQLVENTDRAVATELMRLNKYLDLLIPRGGAGLIRSVVENATVPVIETGTGNCHIFIDATADPDEAVKIVRNAKLQRLGVCNAAESLVIHRDIAEEVLPLIAADLASDACEIRGDDDAQKISQLVVPASEEDYGKEYLDKIISAKIVDSVDEAIAHINKYSTGHSESILTKDYANAQKFLREVDSACVYVNASTRFTDGFEFGFGAEIGISTQKLHARGPMGLLALTSTKYIVYGDGQIRP